MDAKDKIQPEEPDEGPASKNENAMLQDFGIKPPWSIFVGFGAYLH